MLTNIHRKIGAAVIVIGLLGMVLGGFFVSLGFQKADFITAKMIEQDIAYGGAGGAIEGIIDTPREAQVMADILAEHSREIGNYSQLPRDDPRRAQILQALTIENSLNMAVMGYGLTDVVKGTGAFMIMAGGGLALLGTLNLRRKESLG